MVPLCPGTERFYGSSTDVPQPSHLWTSQKLARCCQSSQRAPFKRCFYCECQSCTNFNINKARRCKATKSICGLWLCKSLFQGTSIHLLHISYHVFKLSDLQYVHHAMPLCRLPHSCSPQLGCCASIATCKVSQTFYDVVQQSRKFVTG